MRSRQTLIFITMCLLALAVAIAGCGKKGEGAQGPAPAQQGAGGGVATTVTPGVAVDTSVPASGGEATATGGSGQAAGGSAAGSGDAASGGSQGGSSGSSGSSSSEDANADTRMIKILWWNDAAAQAPTNPEVVFGGKSYRPKPGTNDSGRIGPCPVGEPLELTVYPDGRSGAKLVVKFLVEEHMTSNSDTDAIHVEVQDTTVRVLGNPVVNFAQSFTRQ